MSNLHTYYQFKLDFQKVDQHTSWLIHKWLIHGAKTPQAQSVAEYCSREYKPDIKESKGNTLNTIFK